MKIFLDKNNKTQIMAFPVVLWEIEIVKDMIW